MDKTQLSERNLSELLASILPIVLSKGPSHTTMDLVASTLGISKRTLYEIFENKDEMLREVFHYMHKRGHEKMKEIWNSTPNVIEAMLKVIQYQGEFFKNTNPVFFRDLDERSQHLRGTYYSRKKEHNRLWAIAVQRGIEEGLLNADNDFDMTLRLLRVQLESIKRMENYFPPEITLEQAFRAIARGFLCSIVTHKGLEQLERLEKTENNKQQNQIQE